MTADRHAIATPAAPSTAGNWSCNSSSRITLCGRPFGNSPRIEKIDVHSHSHVRRARLYYLRQRTGKATRLRSKRTFQQN